MYNLDISTAMAAAASNNSATPRTPEIVNSLFAMTNPLDYNYGDINGTLCGATTTTTTKRFYANCGASSDSNSSSSSQESRTGHGHIINLLPPQQAPSLQRTCSQLIKAGLKLSIEQKRKLQCDHEDLLDLDKVKRIKRNESESEEDKLNNCNDLTPEDEERRRRRRERNKIAATKCRLKKRERTNNLISESETLETQNVEFKTQYAQLQKEKQHLEEVLRLHTATCRKDLHNTQHQQEASYNRLPPVHSIETTSNHHSYSRLPPSTSALDTPDGYNHHHQQQQHQIDFDTSSIYTLYKTPSIIVEAVNDDDNYPSLTDLDNPSDNNYGYNYGQQNYGHGHGIDGCLA